MGDLSDAARGGLDDLLGVTLSAMGADRTREVMNLDDVLREVERSVGRPGWERRSSERYWVRVLGDPEDEVWAWHLGGHHVGVHATVVGDTLAITPCFLGANPAVVRGGPMPDCRCSARRSRWPATFSPRWTPTSAPWPWCRPDAPEDIATRHDPVADPDVVPAGLRYDALDRSQAQRLEALVRWYLGRAPDEVAEQAWRAVVDAGLGR